MAVILAFVIEVITLGFCNVVIEVPMLFALLTNYFQFAHKRITSDIPGTVLSNISFRASH